MKLKSLAVLAMVTFLGITTGCNDRYDEGFAAGQSAGYNTGYNDGYSDGDADGYERARQYFQTADYQNGYNAGKADGITIGYNQGYAVGKTDGIAIGLQQGRTEGYNTGYADGYDDGYDDGDAAGYSNGYDDGFDDGSDPAAITAAYNNGLADGYDDGYDAGYDFGYGDGLDDGYDIGYSDGFDDGEIYGYDLGFDDGYDIGFDDGWDAALGLSVGPTKTNSANSKSNLLSKVHNDMVNYAKIKAPKSTARGLELGGKLIFEETSLSSKDLSKRAAAAERYLLSEMSGQIKAKFGLSDDRSIQIAKISNHWRKFSTSRQLTEEDADAFSEALIGVNLKKVETAVKDSLKGDSSELNDLLGTAAQANGTTPERMSNIMNQLFM